MGEGEDEKRETGDLDIEVSAERPCVGEGGGVAVTRCWCFSRIESKMAEVRSIIDHLKTRVSSAKLSFIHFELRKHEISNYVNKKRKTR